MSSGNPAGDSLPKNGSHAAPPTAPDPQTPSQTIPNPSLQRRIYVNLPPVAPFLDNRTQKPLGPTYASNKVHTTKYTLLTFLPKNLYEQFRSVANFYFLSLVILQAFEPFAIVSVALTVAPILIIVLITAAKDATEDWRRHESDKMVNKSITYLLSNWKNTNYEEERNQKKSFNLNVSLRRHRVGLSTPAVTKDPDYITVHDYIPPLPLDDKLNTIPEHVSPNMAKKTTFGGVTYAVDVHKHPVWKKSRWEQVRVGDFVFLRNNDNIPADVIIVSTSEPDAMCYVETKNLDGETNLKVKRGIKEFSLLCSPEECCEMMCYIDCEKPNAHMYTFNGTMVFRPPNAPLDEIRTIPLSINSVLLRGCTIRNTQWVIGIVIATGRDSKLMKNAGITPSKRSTVAKQMNPQASTNVLLNFFILGAMCLICAVLGAFYQGSFNYVSPPFLHGAVSQTDEHPAYTAMVIFFMCTIIFQNIIPIAIYISIDVAETFQSYMMNQDIEMYDEESDRAAMPNSWNLCDELGQVEYIFSDKTGTLTCNIMAFRKCSINGIMYGDPPTDALESSQNSNKEKFKLAEKKMRDMMASYFDTKYVTMNGLTFVDDRMHRHLQEGMAQVNMTGLPSSRVDMSGRSRQAAAIIEFFTLLAICHTVLVETPDLQHPERIHYKAQSPDEEALVEAAKDNGFTFLRRVDNRVEVDIMGCTKTFTILQVLEFNSDRKRMSVIVRKEDEDNVVLLCKGADSVIAQRLRADTDPSMFDSTFSHLESFAKDGLRTLCLAYRIIPNDIYEPWSKKYHEAQSLIQDRDAEIDNVCNLIERDLTLMGATAIEDKLQQGVPESIATLSRAGIKIWILTGDKLETAVNVGFSCNLLEANQILIIIAGTTSEDSTREQLTEALKTFWTSDGKPQRGEAFALIIDGDALKYALLPSCKALLLELACRCKAVVCCRVSPKQKAKVVALSAICLAIGDGANDVSMIQEANVGVGISGKEGMQAVMASDYSIAQFRFLSRLILVHGRWAYIRISQMILDYFYKNVIWLFVVFCFTGDIITEFTYGVFYNTVFTLLPNMLVGMYDQDIDAQIAMHVPQLHQKGMQRSRYNMERFWVCIFEGVYQSVICYFLGIGLFSDATVDPRGLDSGKGLHGTFIAFFCVSIANVCMGFNHWSWTWLTHISVYASIVVFTAYVIAYAESTETATFGIAQVIFLEPAFYLSVILSVVVGVLPRFLFGYISQLIKPSDTQIMLEFQKYIWKKGKVIPPQYTGAKFKEPKQTFGQVSLVESRDDHGKWSVPDSTSTLKQKKASNTNVREIATGHTIPLQSASHSDDEGPMRKVHSESSLPAAPVEQHDSQKKKTNNRTEKSCEELGKNSRKKRSSTLVPGSSKEGVAPLSGSHGNILGTNTTKPKPRKPSLHLQSASKLASKFIRAKRSSEVIAAASPIENRDPSSPPVTPAILAFSHVPFEHTSEHHTVKHDPPSVLIMPDSLTVPPQPNSPLTPASEVITEEASMLPDLPSSRFQSTTHPKSRRPSTSLAEFISSLSRKSKKVKEPLSPFVSIQAQHLADSRPMVFMGSENKEVLNTGFCFSHDEGMQDVIKPSSDFENGDSNDGTGSSSARTPSTPLDLALRRRASLQRRRESGRESSMHSMHGRDKSSRQESVTEAVPSSGTTVGTLSRMVRDWVGKRDSMHGGGHGKDVSITQEAFEMYQLSQMSFGKDPNVASSTNNLSFRPTHNSDKEGSASSSSQKMGHSKELSGGSGGSGQVNQVRQNSSDIRALLAGSSNPLRGGSEAPSPFSVSAVVLDNASEKQPHPLSNKTNNISNTHLVDSPHGSDEDLV